MRIPFLIYLLSAYSGAWGDDTAFRCSAPLFDGVLIVEDGISLTKGGRYEFSSADLLASVIADHGCGTVARENGKRSGIITVSVFAGTIPGDERFPITLPRRYFRVKLKLSKGTANWETDAVLYAQEELAPSPERLGPLLAVSIKQLAERLKKKVSQK